MAQIHPQTETAVANEALSHLLLPAIADLDNDTSQSARVLRKHFASTRDALQRQFPWNFAEAELTLTPDPDQSSVRFTYVYALPNKPYCLKALELWKIHRSQWKVVGRTIQTNRGPQITLIYTSLVTDVAKWDAMFRAAFALALAVACKELCKDLEIVAEVKEAATDALATAWPADASEGTPNEIPMPDVVAAREIGECQPWDHWGDD